MPPPPDGQGAEGVEWEGAGVWGGRGQGCGVGGAVGVEWEGAGVWDGRGQV